mgnify:CR=1 FL=1
MTDYRKPLTIALAVFSLLFLRHMQVQAADAPKPKPTPAVQMFLLSQEANTPISYSAVIGVSAVPIPRSDACGRSDGRLCESRIGNITTDAMRMTYSADFAITNAGGIRANLTCPAPDVPGDFCSSFIPPPYPISRGQVYAVLPFGNAAFTVTISGAELKNMLENGVSMMPAASGRFPQVSGLCFKYNISAPSGSRVLGAIRQAANGTCTGTPVDLTAGSAYGIVINDFIATGGDGYPNLYSRGTVQGIMDQVLSDHIAAAGSVSPSIQGRIVCTTSGATVCPVVIPW